MNRKQRKVSQLALECIDLARTGLQHALEGRDSAAYKSFEALQHKAYDTKDWVR